MQSLNLAHRDYGLIYDKPPMMQTDVAPKRQQRPRGESGGIAPPLEHAEQVSVIKWFHFYARTRGLDYRQLVAVPNAQILFRYANNPHAVLSYLHAEGMRDGMHDLVLFVMRPPYGGCLVEMKRLVNAVVSPDQSEMARILTKAGYRCEVCRGAEAAIQVIKSYVEGACASAAFAAGSKRARNLR